MGKLLSGLWKFIKKYFWIILLIIIIVMAIFFPAALLAVWAWMKPLLATAWKWIGTLSWKQLGVLALGVSSAVAPEWTGKTIGKGAEWVADTVVSVGGSVISGLFKNPLFWGVAGFVTWRILKKRKEGKETDAYANPSSTRDTLTQEDMTYVTAR